MIVIEVKVKASESRDDQIERYQEYIANCPEPNKSVVYLTIDGNPPTTDSPNYDPVVRVSWREIAEMISECSGYGEEHDFRVQFCKHIRRNILMEREEERKFVIELLREGNNYESIRKINENYPQLGDREYIEKFKNIVQKLIYGDNPGYDMDEIMNLEVYPTMGDTVRVLKIRVTEWDNANLPFTLMLSNEEKSGVRIVLGSEYYSDEQYHETLINFSNFSGDIVGEYPEIWGKWWRAILNHDSNFDEVPRTVIDRKFFEEEFWLEVEQKLECQLDELLPCIERYMKAN